jgi:hypothetical protein
MRATSIPAPTKRSIIFEAVVAGPRVQTILALRFVFTIRIPRFLDTRC